MEKITLKGLRSTCSVMDWIEANGCPDLHEQFFEFPDDQRPFLGTLFPSEIVVSTREPERATLKLHPVESWHQVTPTQRRLNCDGLGWYAFIGGKYYWMTT